MVDRTNLPPCGLYRTTLPLPEREDNVMAGMLVYYHNHSEQGPPLILLPEKNVDNRWSFHERGYLVEQPTWSETLVSLPQQGYYRVVRELRLENDRRLPENLLVQLGYNRAATPIAFPGRLEAGNRIAFPVKGMKLTDLQLDALQPAGFLLLSPRTEATPAVTPDEPTVH